MIAWPSQLRARGILGMNQRNGDFIMRYNQRSRYPLVDDKLQTKRLAEQHGIAVPALYGVVEIQRQTRHFANLVGNQKSFVIKPAQGAGGNGVLVITGRRGTLYQRSNGMMMTSDEIEFHLGRIISGLFSLGGVPDKALIEYMVRFDPIFEEISYQGVPDLRVIVFRGVPVASMVRLPTRQSDGKANLHQGAIGVGIDLVSGRTGSGVCDNAIATHHPDTDAPVGGRAIPHWNVILELAARCADLVGLGYLGVDIVLDRDLGPLVLELNARPGLNVQLANGTGLLANLSKIESLSRLPESPADRVALAQSLGAGRATTA
jgi:alpha-L-glutamate ligase-like protein